MIRKMHSRCVLSGLLIAMMLGIPGRLHADHHGALSGVRHRVLVSTDIGGTDPDDFQSMVHLLLYADVLDIEGLVASPYGEGRKRDILRVIDHYEKDYKHLRTYSDKYPAPDALRALTQQGETECAPYAGVRRATEGSNWMIQCAKKPDQRPLHVLVWGGLEDLAQALHDAPEIVPKLRVYWIGGPNKKWGFNAYQYIVERHPSLWMIENNSTYRGWFVGGNQSDHWGNRSFVRQRVRGKGSLGDFFFDKKDDLKMGDTPSVAWLLKGTPENPSSPGWGGQFVRAWKRPYMLVEGIPTSEQTMEVFGVIEMVLPLKGDAPDDPQVHLIVENQTLQGHLGDGKIHLRFCPKAAKTYRFTLKSNIPSYDGMTGGIRAKQASPEMAEFPSNSLTHWWTDDPDPRLAEGNHSGAGTISRWREEFLGDFATRLNRCRFPETPE